MRLTITLLLVLALSSEAPRPAHVIPADGISPRTPSEPSSGNLGRTPAPWGHMPERIPAAVSRAVAGVASWFCNANPARGPVSPCTHGHPDGPETNLYAAVRRGSGLRGYVKVCAAACVVVRVIDCNCGRRANLIDLYADAFTEIAPLSAGVISVTVSPFDLPATDR